MNTLCVLLPVYNAHFSLESSVAELLEILPELTDHFELCILDDGSTDDTVEVARELAACYPQITLVRHPLRLGLAESIQTALDHTQGEVILIGDEDYCLDPEDLRTLWQLRDYERRLGRPAIALDSAQQLCVHRLLDWKPGIGLSTAGRGFQVIRRAAFEQYRARQAAEMFQRGDRRRGAGDQGPARPATPLRPNFLAKPERFAWQE